MDLFWQFFAFLIRIIVGALLLGMLLRNLPNTLIPLTERRQTITLSIAISVISNFIYAVLIYPFFLSPLNAFPAATLFDFRELLPITIQPRGRIALSLVKKFPGADAIHLRVIPGAGAVLPVSPQAHRDVLSVHVHDYIKPSAGTSFLRRALGLGLILSEGETHARHRKIVQPSFRVQNIRSLQGLIAEKCAEMLVRVQDEMSRKGRIEISSWGSRMTFDIIGPALMSRDFKSLETPDSPLETAYAELIAPSRGQAFLFEMSFFMPQWLVKWIPIRTNGMIERNCDLIKRTCVEILREKIKTLKSYDLEDESGTADILGSIMANGDLSEEELVDQMMTFLGAGHETTASSIAWATHLLTLPQYFHYQALLRKEIRDAVANLESADPKDGILPYATLEKLPLLNGICEEVLRLYPPVTNTGRRAIRDTFIAGTRIAKGTLVVIFPWAINRNPEFWGANAEALVPERWIDTAEDGTRRSNRHGGAPSNMCEQTFLHGNRSCIGRDFARAELRYVIAALFEKFELKRCLGDDGSVIPAGSLTIKPKGGLYVEVRPAE